MNDVAIGGRGVGGGRGGAELAYDKNLHKKLFDSVVEYERFYRYLRYASIHSNTWRQCIGINLNNYCEKMGNQGQRNGLRIVSGKDGCWMMAHSGPGLLNTNCSMEVHWRVLKAATLGSAGSSGWGI